jgi:hypothetical protein
MRQSMAAIRDTTIQDHAGGIIIGGTIHIQRGSFDKTVNTTNTTYGICRGLYIILYPVIAR